MQLFFFSFSRFINARRRIVQPMIDQSNRAGTFQRKDIDLSTNISSSIAITQKGSICLCDEHVFLMLVHELSQLFLTILLSFSILNAFSLFFLLFLLATIPSDYNDLMANNPYHTFDPSRTAPYGFQPSLFEIRK